VVDLGRQVEHNTLSQSSVRRPEKRHGLEETKIDIRDLRKFDRSVSRMVTDLINTYGIRYRIQSDGVHVLLYPLGEYDPSERGARHKVSASRGAVQTLEWLEKWCQKYVAPALVNKQAEMLAARFNDPSKVRRLKAADRPSEPATASVAGVPTPALAAQETATSPGTQPPAGFEQHYIGSSGEPSNWWVKIGGGEWRCKSCDYSYKGSQLHAAHQRAHTMTPEELSGSAKGVKKGDARLPAFEIKTERVTPPTNQAKTTPKVVDGSSAQVKAARTRKIRKAVRMISEATGVDLGDTAMLERKIARLTADLAKATTERDDLKARLDLMREAMRA